MKTSIVAKQLRKYFEMPLYWYHMFESHFIYMKKIHNSWQSWFNMNQNTWIFADNLRAAWLFFVVAYNHIGKVNTITQGASKWAKLRKFVFTLIIHPQPPCSTNYLLILGFRSITGAGLWWAFRQFNQKDTFGSCRCSPSRLQYKNRDKA